jgi:hypothetical protein
VSGTFVSMSFFRLVLVRLLFSFSFGLTQHSFAFADDSLFFYRQLPAPQTQDKGTLSEVLPRVESAQSCESFWQKLDPQTEKIRPAFLKDPKVTLDAQHEMMTCGKWLFFYMPVPTQVAVPDVLLQALMKTFPKLTGPAMTDLGFRENPREPGQPLEMPAVPSAKTPGKFTLPGKGRTLACTACHLGTLPNGEFNVGMPNDALNLGMFSQLTSYPLWLSSRHKSHDVPWDPVLREKYEAMWESSKGRFNLPRVLLDLSALIDFLNLQKKFFDFVGQDPLPLTDQRTFYKSGRGRLNPATPMLSEPNQEIYVSTPPIWNMTHFENTKMSEPYLGRVISSRSLEEFVRQAYVLSTLDTLHSTPKYVDPVAAYVRSLKSPQKPAPKNSLLYDRGELLFNESCKTCHNGTEGGTTQNHELDEVNSPLVFDQIFKNYEPPTRQSKQALSALQKVGMLPLERTGIKSRRLNGLWARSRLTTNGAVEGIDALFCLGSKSRLTLDRNDPLSDHTHSDLCHDLDFDSKLALKEFLSFRW